MNRFLLAALVVIALAVAGLLAVISTQTQTIAHLQDQTKLLKAHIEARDRLVHSIGDAATACTRTLARTLHQLGLDPGTPLDAFTLPDR